MEDGVGAAGIAAQLFYNLTIVRPFSVGNTCLINLLVTNVFERLGLPFPVLLSTQGSDLDDALLYAHHNLVDATYRLELVMMQCMLNACLNFRRFYCPEIVGGKAY